MEKISRRGSNNFCPQALYLYGTYKEDEKLTLVEKLALVKPVVTTANNYFSMGTESLGFWGQPDSTL